MKHKIEIDPSTKQDLVGRIKEYFSNERGEDLGDLAASFVLDFFMEEIAPTFYNKGVEDAHTYLSEKLDDLFEIQK